MKTFNQVLCEVRYQVAAGADQPGEILRELRGPVDKPEANFLTGHEHKRTELAKIVESIVAQYKAEVAPFPYQQQRFVDDLARDSACADAVAVVLGSPVPAGLGPRALREIEESLFALHNPQAGEASWRMAFEVLAEGGYDVAEPRARFEAQYPVLPKADAVDK